MFARTTNATFTAVASALVIAGAGLAAPAQAAVAPAHGTAVVQAVKVTSPAPIRRGSRGQAVKVLQHTLAGFHLNSPAGVGRVGTPDGIFGAATERAVKGVQVRNGLKPTGVVDARTWNALGFVSAKLSSEGPVLRHGDRAVYVSSAQNLLRLSGRHVAIDGIFGSATVVAVKSLQKAHRMPQTGVIDVPTWRVLRSYMR